VIRKLCGGLFLVVVVALAGCSAAQDGATSTDVPTAAAVGQGATDQQVDTPAVDVAPTPAGPPPATVPVAASAGGNITETVEAGEPPNLPTASLNETVEVEGSVDVSLAGLARTEAVGQGIGQLSGPAIKATVKLANNSDTALELTSVTVSAEDAAGLPLSPLEAEESVPFAGSLEPGDEVEAVILFRTTQTNPGPYTVAVHPFAEAAIARFVSDSN
jgi:hypothetical protein